MTLVTASMPSPLTRTTLPGTARPMPWHDVRHVTASTTGRGAELAAAAAVAPPAPGRCPGRRLGERRCG